MKTKLFTLLLAVVVSVGTMFAEKVRIGDLYYNLDATNQTAEVKHLEDWYEFLTTANIPASVTYDAKTYSVTSIGDYAFRGCSGLTSVTIGNRVTSIGEEAFYGCTGLTSVTIGNSVTSIGEEAFRGCSGLTSVTIGNSVTSIGDYAFYGCTGWTSVTIGNSVSSIGEEAFRGCSGLTSVTIPNSVSSIGEDAFTGCTGLTSVYITDFAAWCGISAGEYVTYGSYYYGSSFGGLYNLYLNEKLITDLIIPSNITSRGNGAFAHSSIKSVVVSGGCQSIGDGAFYRCDSLTSVVIQRGCQSIGNEAFKNSDNITSITIPSTLTNIGNFAFSTGKIETVYNYATTPQDMSSYSGYEMLYRGILALATLYVPQQSINAYKSAYFWKYFGNILPVQTPEPQAIENISDDDSFNASEGKILRDGQIFILRGDKTYTLQGQEVK